MLQYLQNGYTSLHCAARNGHSEIVQLLITAGATDSPDQVGMSVSLTSKRLGIQGPASHYLSVVWCMYVLCRMFRWFFGFFHFLVCLFFSINMFFHVYKQTRLSWPIKVLPAQKRAYNVEVPVKPTTSHYLLYFVLQMGETALDKAIDKNHTDVVQLLLQQYT